MTYDTLIKSISEIINNPDIVKTGLSLTYELPEHEHKELNEELFYKTKSVGINFTPMDEYEVELGGILIKFVKQK